MGIHSYTYQIQLLLLHSATPARQREADPTFTNMLSLLFTDFTYKLGIPRKQSMNNSARVTVAS